MDWDKHPVKEGYPEIIMKIKELRGCKSRCIVEAYKRILRTYKTRTGGNRQLCDLT